nr:MAG TPA: hypothetical protein [Caudoviricetes sp.]
MKNALVKKKLLVQQVKDNLALFRLRFKKMQ